MFFKLRLQNPSEQTTPRYKVKQKSESPNVLSDVSDLNKIKEKHNLGVHYNTHILKTSMFARINIKTTGCRTCGMK